MIEQILRGAEIRTPVYTCEHRIDDERQLRERIDEILARRAHAARCAADGWLVPSSPQLAALILQTPETSRGTVWQLKRRLHKDLKALCRLVINAPSNADRLAGFAEADRPTDPVGARAFGCLLYLNGHDVGARFWWRFATGADDATAAYCLFLEGLLRDEIGEALHCFRAHNGGGFLSDQDWDTTTTRNSRTETALEAEVGEQIAEVNTGQAGAAPVPVPQGYLEGVSEEHLDELLCHQ